MKQETKAYCKALTNIILALIGLVLLIIVLPRVLSFFMPFVVAWIIALLASPMVKFLEEKLKMITGTKVTINRKTEKSGRIEIEYYTPEDLEKIIGLLNN